MKAVGWKNLEAELSPTVLLGGSEMAEKKKKWIQKASERMEEKGTKGAFGKATAKKIAAGKKKGGLAKKRAVFAENMKKIAKKSVSGSGPFGDAEMKQGFRRLGMKLDYSEDCKY